MGNDTFRMLSALYAVTPGDGVIDCRPVSLEDTEPERRRVARYRMWPNVSSGIIDHEAVARFVLLSDLHRFHPFFGVNLRTRPAGRTRGGTVQHYGYLPALFVDCDDKYQGEAAIRGRIAGFPHPPSIVVRSGGGFHLYWLLADGIDCRTPEGYAFGRHALQRIAFAFADVCDVTASEVARVLRLPGTLNHKYTPPRAAVLESCDANVRYALDDLLSACPGGRAASVSSGGCVVQRLASSGCVVLPLEVPEEVALGDRHETLRRVGRSLVARGVSIDAAIAACQAENRVKCRPPIAVDELNQYLGRVLEQRDQLGFTRTRQSAGDLLGALLEIGVSTEAALIAARSVDAAYVDDLLQACRAQKGASDGRR